MQPESSKSELQQKEELQQTIKEKISYSEFKVWQDCPHKHKLQYIDQVGKFEGNEYTAFGTALHHVCENVVEDNSIKLEDLKILFLKKMIEEVAALKEKEISLDKELLISMKDQGSFIIKYILSSLKETFGDFEVISVEEEIYEDMSIIDFDQTNFKGFIDLVIRTKSDNKYHIIDWKTCSWGWNAKKRSDSVTTYQLTYYKTFFSQKHNIPLSEIETHFALLKRTAKKDPVEIFRVTSGERKINNSLKMLEKTVKNINKGVSYKNRLSCKYCNFYKTEHCT